MNKLVLFVIFVVATLLSYVLYAVTQDSGSQMSASEYLLDSVSAESDPVLDLRQEKTVESQMAESLVRHQRLDSRQLHTLQTPDNAASKQAVKSPLKLVIQSVKRDALELAREVKLEFTNTSDKTVRIVKPLDGSYYGWYQPHYEFTVKNAAGESQSLMGRCGISGLWADTTFPESYVVEIEPGKTHRETAILPFLIKETGEYQVSFKYTYDFQVKQGTAWRKGTEEDHWNQPVEGVWQGSILSNSINMNLNKNN